MEIEFDTAEDAADLAEHGLSSALALAANFEVFHIEEDRRFAYASALSAHSKEFSRYVT